MTDSLAIGGVVGPLNFQLRGTLQGGAGVSVEPRRNVELRVAANRTGKGHFPVVARARSLGTGFGIIPRATFLAQHISQEVAPRVPGRDQFAVAAQAYSQARDYNLEVLSRGPGLRIKV